MILATQFAAVAGGPNARARPPVLRRWRAAAGVAAPARADSPGSRPRYLPAPPRAGRRRRSARAEHRRRARTSRHFAMLAPVSWQGNNRRRIREKQPNKPVAPGDPLVV